MAGEALVSVVAATAVGGVVELALAAVAYRNRERPGARAFGWLSLAAGGWALLQVAVLLAPSAEIARGAHLLAGAVASQIPMLWLVFAVVYAGHREWLTPGRLVALWTPLTAYSLVRLTAPVHGVALAPVRIVTENGVTAPASAESLPFAAYSLVAYALVLAGYLLLVAFLLDSRNVYRAETGALVLGGLFPTAGTVVVSVAGGVHPGISVGPAMFAVHGVVAGLVLFRYDFQGVAPVATDLLAEELEDPVVILGDDDVVIDHNPAAERLVDDGDLSGRHADAVADGFAERLADGAQVTVDAPGYDREMSSFSIGVTTVEDQYGVAKGRLVHLRDVSDQQRRLDQLTAMQAATQRFIGARTAAEVADIAVRFASDVHDQPYAALFRYDEATDALVSEAVTDRLAAELRVGPDESIRVPRESGPLWTTFEDGELAAFEGERDLVIGPYAFGSASALFLPLGDHGVLVIGTDEGEGYTETDEQLGGILARTTETALTRIEYEEELRASRIAVERRNKQIEFFNGVLRHNIRNAMLVIDGHAQHLQTRVGDGDAEKLGTIRTWCSDLTDMTEKIRAVNDTVTASEDKRLERVDLSTVLREEVDALSGRYDVAVESDVADGLTVAANDLVADVVEGVLSNAVEHNDSSRPRVRVTTEPMGEWVQVRIADDGPGLSEEMQTQVFQREMATSQTAHGFGLYFVSVMMDLYNGNVWFEDGEGLRPAGGEVDRESRGTVVVLEFQLAEESPELSAGE
ncbi:histidine kinase N-terminal 7TM domain-containing protein [Halosimplex pelagicum]|uniref:ATP-binding protein n=1 Tax=Halosimplex pelagicum TaxID=869886 RepID=A0A7D5PCG8_9EURY|nr:histidine kinase N-terminal 7TM domain-containing protein [Halosimplex pelagicum]QLH83265.1 ATP-binding protein [Halosimplex pelagicum]